MSDTPSWGEGKATFRRSTWSRHLALFEAVATSAVTLGSIEFSVNGRPSEAVEGGVTSVRLTSGDDRSVRADQYFSDMSMTTQLVFLGRDAERT